MFLLDEKMRTTIFCVTVVAVVIVIGIEAVQLGSPNLAARRPVTQADMDRWKKELSNWGRWGPADEKGTLNLITPNKRKQAAGLVRDGITVSLARDASTEKAIDNPQPYEHRMNNVGAAASSDRFSISFHGLFHTHLDALGHHFLDGKLYNGFSRDEWVTMQDGARKGSIHNVKGGVFTRGILFDIPRLKGVPYLEPGTAIYVEDLEAWERQAGIKVTAGDAIFIRTGRWARRAKVGPWEIGKLDSGLDASVIPWLRQRDVALIGSESALDVVPIPPANTITNPDDYRPVHNFVLVALGMNVFDNCTLDDLAEAAAARKRWEFLLTASPLPIVTGTGSPINPIAVF
jgi:kynurenine formamidase